MYLTKLPLRVLSEKNPHVLCNKSEGQEECWKRLACQVIKMMTNRWLILIIHFLPRLSQAGGTPLSVLDSVTHI